jgi:hypothetical protein
MAENGAGPGSCHDGRASGFTIRSPGNLGRGSLHSNCSSVLGRYSRMTTHASAEVEAGQTSASSAHARTAAAPFHRLSALLAQTATGFKKSGGRALRSRLPGATCKIRHGGNHVDTKARRCGLKAQTYTAKRLREAGIWSGRRDSNPRPQPWQGCALPLSYTRAPGASDRPVRLIKALHVQQSGAHCKGVAGKGTPGNRRRSRAGGVRETS